MRGGSLRGAAMKVVDMVLATAPASPARALRRAAAQARAWGWPGAIGLAGVVTALVAAATWLPALQQRAEALGTEADATESRSRRLDAQRRLHRPPVPTSQRFRDGFPSDRVRQERLAALMALATEHGLEPRRAEFRLTPEAELGLSRYSVGMPITGPYAQMRAFIEEALARDPALGLDRVRLRRANVNPNAATVEMELDWTLYMQADLQPDLQLAAPTRSVRSASPP